MPLPENYYWSEKDKLIFSGTGEVRGKISPMGNDGYRFEELGISPLISAQNCNPYVFSYWRNKIFIDVPSVKIAVEKQMEIM